MSKGHKEKVIFSHFKVRVHFQPVMKNEQKDRGKGVTTFNEGSEKQIKYST